MTDEQILEIQEDVAYWYGVEMDPAQVERFLDLHPDLAETIEGNGFDTVERERFINALTKDLGMRSWPINGEGPEVWRRFVEEFEQKATAAGLACGFEHPGEGT